MVKKRRPQVKKAYQAPGYQRRADGSLVRIKPVTRPIEDAVTRYVDRGELKKELQAKRERIKRLSPSKRRQMCG